MQLHFVGKRRPDAKPTSGVVQPNCSQISRHNENPRRNSGTDSPPDFRALQNSLIMTQSTVAAVCDRRSFVGSRKNRRSQSAATVGDSAVLQHPPLKRGVCAQTTFLKTQTTFGSSLL